ncbi:Glycosaminoglycan xylosylkinase [Camelus dromedarius]|uniref:Glycosaminoglycan xylosylkinase n=1 Tax=Camelus dromedarius TaxID=9838 RepID=A0A5N4CQI9_CAMDR|nr:Glycosaminoglycan xylosylkinase [Camelus dromedarius]
MLWPATEARHPWGGLTRGQAGPVGYDESYCDAVKKTSPYDSGLASWIIDTAVFDYLIGNADRHHYESFQDDEAPVCSSFSIMPKALGTPRWMREASWPRSISVHVVTHVKSIRVSTWNRLNYLKNGVLKSALKSALAHDPISPVLSEPHLDAVDQRLQSVLATVKQCTDQFGMDTVLVEDRMPLSHL